MSYNTRRGAPNQNLGNIGSRRPVVTNNFVSGGQLTPQKGGIQQGQQQQGYSTQQQQTNRPQQAQQKQVVTQQQQLPSQQLPSQQQQQQQKQQSLAQQQQQQQQPEQQPILQKEEGTENGAEVKVEGEKRKWPHRKIPKKEKMRRRNTRLSKLLQPKNALMILNELVKNPTYSVVDFASVEGTQYKATVLVDGVGHCGFGKSKVGAKNNAAEVAIKYLIKNKKISQFCASDGDEKMDISETNEDTDAPIPWQQVASFAIHKLFTSWGEDLSVTVKEEYAPKELRPAKKLPENAASLNPLMVVNQMFPHAQYEEMSQVGMPPNTTYTMKCTIDNTSFTGTGTTKKMAKKNAAYAACINLLGIEYPPEANVPPQ